MGSRGGEVEDVEMVGVEYDSCDALAGVKARGREMEMKWIIRCNTWFRHL